MKIRYESFGGIISLEKPPMLVFANQEYIKKLGFEPSPLWKRSSKRLSAPTEIHFAITNRCNQNCSHCYMSSQSNSAKSLTHQSVNSYIDEFAKAGVFHLALGGGESFMHPDLFEIAHYAKKQGLVPNLTTNGTLINKHNAEQCRVFGQINVSLDSLDEQKTAPRCRRNLRATIESIRLLKKHNKRVGINCVVNRFNFSEIESMIQFAKKLRLADVEFLRLKPAGRGQHTYDQFKCTQEQHNQFFDSLIRFSKKYRQNVKIDCSYVPMACATHPKKMVLEKFKVTGCDGGNLLAAVDPDGHLKACSFAKGHAGPANDFASRWETSAELKKFCDWKETAGEPCASCEYLDICSGGCHVVSEHLRNDFFSPDPECPIVCRYHRGI